MDDVAGPESLPALVTVTAGSRAFTFRPADADADYPIYLPADNVVTPV